MLGACGSSNHHSEERQQQEATRQGHKQGLEEAAFGGR